MKRKIKIQRKKALHQKLESEYESLSKQVGRVVNSPEAPESLVADQEPSELNELTPPVELLEESNE